MARQTTQSSISRVHRLPGLQNLEVLSARLTNHHFPLHFHETFVLEWITAGSDQCSGTQRTARRGQLFVHGPRVPHAGSPGGTQALEYRACYPTISLVGELLDLAPHELPQVGTQVLGSKALQRASQKLFARLESTEETGHSLRTRADLRELLLHVFDHGCSATDLKGSAKSEAIHSANSAPSNSATQPVRAALQLAREHLVRNLARDVTTAELSEVCGLSRYHLIREFKRALGITPRQFLISQRVAVARDLLAAGTPIAEVAGVTGFADQSHLHRHFKRVTAFSPGQAQSAKN